MAAPAIVIERIRLVVFRLREFISVKAGMQTVKSAVARITPTRQVLRSKLSTKIEEPQYRVRMRKIIIKQQTDIFLKELQRQRMRGFTRVDYNYLQSFWLAIFRMSYKVIILPLLILAIELSYAIIYSSPFFTIYLGISRKYKQQKINPATAGTTMNIPATILQSFIKKLEMQMSIYPTVQKICMKIEYFYLSCGSQYSVRQLKLNFIAPSDPQFTKKRPTPVTHMLMEQIERIDPKAMIPLKIIIKGRLPKESTMKALRNTLTKNPKQTKPNTAFTASDFSQY